MLVNLSHGLGKFPLCDILEPSFFAKRIHMIHLLIGLNIWGPQSTVKMFSTGQCIGISIVAVVGLVAFVVCTLVCLDRLNCKKSKKSLARDDVMCTSHEYRGDTRNFYSPVVISNGFAFRFSKSVYYLFWKTSYTEKVLGLPESRSVKYTSRSSKATNYLSNLECAVCLEVFKRDSNVVVLDCCHGFHKRCIIRWFQETETCPLCQRQVNVDVLSEPPLVDFVGKLPTQHVAIRMSNIWWLVYVHIYYVYILFRFTTSFVSFVVYALLYKKVVYKRVVLEWPKP